MERIELIRWALKEDLPNGDLTTDSLGVEEFFGRARLIAKEDLVLSGKEFFSETMEEMDSSVKIHWQYENGDFVLNSQTIASLSGNLLQILKAERVALNFLGHFSGIATYTLCFVKEISGNNCHILDTRKTHPLYRQWEKMAVRHGQGKNHRMNLSEAILIKENHIRVAGGIREAVESIRAHDISSIEVECTSLKEVKEAVDLNIQRILLDNMDNETMKEAVKMIPKSISIEASGNMTLERVKSVAETGVQFISIGALTHSAPAADFSLLFDWKK